MNGVPAEDNAMDQTGVRTQVAVLLLVRRLPLLNGSATHDLHCIRIHLVNLGETIVHDPPDLVIKLTSVLLHTGTGNSCRLLLRLLCSLW